MENFFFNGEFCHDFDSLIMKLTCDPEELPEDWQATIELTDHEHMMQFDSDTVVDLLVDHVTDSDRTSEDGDEVETVEKILKEKFNFDFTEINAKMPKLHYVNGKTEVVTKADLIEFIS